MNKHTYKEGFYTKIKSNTFKQGINKKIIKKISQIRNEPSWLLCFRLKAYKIWKKMKEPHWLNGKYKKINYQKYIYYSAPKKKQSHKIKKTFQKLGINLTKKSNTAVDAIFDSISVITTYQKKLSKLGIIFCSLKEAIIKYSKIVKKYLCSVVPINDNFYAALNAAVFSDGTFILIPKNVKCPIDLSTYFRINTSKSGQFERTIIIVQSNSSLKYIEGCSAPIKKQHQLHAAVIEIILYKNAKLQYVTIQNWFPGKNLKKNGILNFVTKRAICKKKNSQMSWIQIELGSAINWKYPSIILKGNNSIGNFFSISITKLQQQYDTGTKIIHIGKKTKSLILTKSISTEKSKNTYRSLVKIKKNADKSKNFTQCDSLIIGNQAKAYTFPCIKINNTNSIIEHEASSCYIKKEQIFYLLTRGINKKKAISMILYGFCEDIMNMLPTDYKLEIKDLISKKNI